ncbi:MAG: glycosyltransferase family 4 protein [Hyphomicrobiales bacterium]|nr:glycosyltransferase family 4 protein [Hyphomicrobiales bacterium]
MTQAAAGAGRPWADGGRRSLVLDLTFAQQGLHRQRANGIDRVDRKIVGHFLQRGFASGVVLGLPQPGIWSLQQARDELGINAAGQDSGSDGPSAGFGALRAWLRKQAAPSGVARSGPRDVAARLHADWLSRVHVRARHKDRSLIPEGAVYFNASQHALFFAPLTRWFAQRPDLRKVFFVHDLLPLLYPEFWRAGHETQFLRVAHFISNEADTLIAASTTVVEQYQDFIRRHAKPLPRIEVLPIPSMLEPSGDHAPALEPGNYFVLIATLEPRKNHVMILQIWQELAARMADPPKLVLIGGDGWENQHIKAVLERATSGGDLIRRFHGLSGAELAAVVGGARALLMPSLAEGYGLPIVEALGMGTPVIASDIAVFREVSQGAATLIDPLDGPGWRRAILEHDAAWPGGARAGTMHKFRAPRWPDFFERLAQILEV